MKGMGFRKSDLRSTYSIYCKAHNTSAMHHLSLKMQREISNYTQRRHYICWNFANDITQPMHINNLQSTTTTIPYLTFHTTHIITSMLK